jgi:hypothetical protein
MTKPAVFRPILLALGAMILVPAGGAQAQNAREEEGPMEIEKCQTISQPGSYRLVKNLTFSGPVGGSCLSITIGNVTIDLAGFTISGPFGFGPSPGSAGIAAGDNNNGIAVRNGSISGFNAGVDLRGNGSIVEGLRILNSFSVGIAAVGIVKGNTVLADGVDGVGTGISATGIITGNYVSARAVDFGIGPGSTVISNIAVANPGAPPFGIIVECPSNVTDNTSVNHAVNLLLEGDGCNNTNNVAP